MTIDLAFGLLIASVVVCALAVGVSLDQSIKQLPTRRRIGVLAYAEYSQAADLHGGLVFYVPLGVVWALVNVGAGVAGWMNGASGSHALALSLLGAAVAGHILLTTLAAPTLGSQRAVVDVVALTAAVWALVTALAESPRLG